MRTLRHLAMLLPIWLAACATAPKPPVASAPDAARTSANTLFERGMEFARRGDTLRAEQYITLAVESGFPRAQSILPLVQVCIASSRLRAALTYAQPYLRSHPRAWPLRYLVASIELALGHESTALRELQRVVAQQPEAAHAHYLIAVIERDSFRDDEGARASFESYVARAPRGQYAPEALAWLADHPAVGGTDLDGSAASTGAVP
jgi:predicted Zn-dependent protease